MNTHLQGSSLALKSDRKRSNYSTGRLLLVMLLAVPTTLSLATCGSQGGGSRLENYQARMGASAAPPAPPGSPPEGMAAPTAQKVAAPSGGAAAEVPRPQPQLIKKAELTLVVKSMPDSIKSVTTIAQQQQGDLLSFHDQKPSNASDRHSASMQLRVPQERLDATLKALAQLGIVQSQSLTAEDVSDQLVDTQARLRNLRQSEDALLKIMNRSGSVGDVLKVSQELSQVRESIERMDAQFKNLQNQVAYSTINLNLEVALSATPTTTPPLTLRMQETWGKATHSVGEFTTSLLALTLWLLAYSPYFLLVGGAVYAWHRYQKWQKPTVPLSPQKPPTSD